MVQFSLKEATERGRVEERERIIRLIEDAEIDNRYDIVKMIEESVQ